MKKMDKYSKRGYIFGGIALIGLMVELFFRKPAEVFVVVFYGMIVVLSLFLIFIWKDPEK